MEIDGFKEIATGVMVYTTSLFDTQESDSSTRRDLSPPADIMQRIKEKGEYFTAADFSIAGVDTGRDTYYGQRVMFDIARMSLDLEADNTRLLSSMETLEKAYMLDTIMANPDLTVRGSRNRLLLEADMVFDIWQADDSKTTLGREVPRLDRVGHQVLSAMMLFRPDFVERRL